MRVRRRLGENMKKGTNSSRNAQSQGEPNRGKKEPAGSKRGGSGDSRIDEGRIRVERVANSLRGSLLLPDRVGKWKRRDWSLASSPSNGELLSEFVMSPKPGGSGLGMVG
ncbi:hypothetical protein AKJ62_03605 [candidate division MSBL1 archaeon SCGC-AAA259D14]|uniref:Uncharacterized protein n=1 Tax=candidate division MSBL1 archaeon SCGC-AAA259D14 TaxID=1698261 RepID=A0A133U4V5_9EURY|nr:hypothetical protein AKJ62_03605 [candidate division MSBL1 archaeon SCGC-AAA259D14]